MFEAFFPQPVSGRACRIRIDCGDLVLAVGFAPLAPDCSLMLRRCDFCSQISLLNVHTYRHSLLSLPCPIVVVS